MNKIVHTGHAGFIFYLGNIKIVCDHWSSTYRPFSNSWKKLETDNFSKKIKFDILNPDYIWCSHAHGDHYDPTYIKKVNKNAKIVIPDFSDNSFYNILKKEKFKNKIIKLKDKQKLNINKFGYIQIFFEEPSYTNHSSLFIKSERLNIFHNADTTINDSFKKKLLKFKDLKKIDYLIGQYTNPTPYPWSIKMSAIKKNKEGIEMHYNALNSFVNMITDLKPKYALPCAGPALVEKHKIKSYKKAYDIIYDKKNNLLYLNNKKKTLTKILNVKSSQEIKIL
jgi:L-ascorbate metabolism protein UlaG (beta-lactamase superfamily)